MRNGWTKFRLVVMNTTTDLKNEIWYKNLSARRVRPHLLDAIVRFEYKNNGYKYDDDSDDDSDDESDDESDETVNEDLNMILYNAVRENMSLEYVTTLIKNGADVNYKRRQLKMDGKYVPESSFENACRNGNAKVAYMLIESGAELENIRRREDLQLSAIVNFEFPGNADKEDHLEILKLLLRIYDPEVEEFYQAIEDGKREVVAAYLDAPSDDKQYESLRKLGSVDKVMQAFKDQQEKQRQIMSDAEVDAWTEYFLEHAE